ncbi:MAG TPA: hypothetical protein VGD65_08145 [Chryseosolibacter sp.]
MAAGKKQQFVFKGETRDDSILIGSHGDATVVIDGNFDLSGIVYCPKYTLTVSVSGTGIVAFRGIANRVVIKKMSGDCTLDLRDLTCKELRCESARKKSRILSGKTRVVSKATLYDEAILQFSDRPLITSSLVSGNAQIIQGSSDVILSQR